MTTIPNQPLTLLKPADYATDQDVRWCPGCGDYSILAQMKKVCAKLGMDRSKMVFVSGIGCSSRFPYYMNTYGFHSIHGNRLEQDRKSTRLNFSHVEISYAVFCL